MGMTIDGLSYWQAESEGFLVMTGYYVRMPSRPWDWKRWRRTKQPDDRIELNTAQFLTLRGCQDCS